MPSLCLQIISDMEGQESRAELETMYFRVKEECSRMGKTCKYEDQWTFTEAWEQKGASSGTSNSIEMS